MTYCPDCDAEVVHQKIPEDQEHCECSGRPVLIVHSHVGEPINMDLGPCSCPCHCCHCSPFCHDRQEEDAC